MKKNNLGFSGAIKGITEQTARRLGWSLECLRIGDTAEYDLTKLSIVIKNLN